MAYKIGSLFDGSGGFPLAGSLCGMEPVWAAEVEPYPIAVTRSRFPNMIHLGSVTDINGGEILPVDIITFGSPCQDLSVAGKRAGLKHEANGDEETTRSGLFMEAVRIIKEMREATNGEYPTFALWENVPGAFSSNKGEDFRTVCEELIKIVEPDAVMPEVPKNGWPYADSYIGDGWSLAYRTFDAQYWGVPQRRRRIHLVADFRGERAREVLFEREGVRGYFETGRTQGEGTAPDAEGRLDADDRAGEIAGRTSGGLAGGAGRTGGTGEGGSDGRGLDAVIPFAANQRDEVRELGDKAGALQAAPGMKQQTFIAYTLEPGIAAREGGHIYEGVSGTLRAEAGDNRMAVAYSFDARGNGTGETVPTLTGDHQNRVTDYTAVVCEENFVDVEIEVAVRKYEVDTKKLVTVLREHKGALTNREIAEKLNRPLTMVEHWFRTDNSFSIPDPDVWMPLKQLLGIQTDEFDQSIMVFEYKGGSYDMRNRIHTGDVAPTLTCGSGSDLYLLPKPVFCLQGNGIDRADTAGCNGAGWREDASYTLNTIDRPAVAYATDVGFFNSVEGQSPTLLARMYKDPHLVTYPETAVRYIVRRLTPTECARLQGFPDLWGHPDQKTELTDEEYQFWLNVRNTHAAINGRAVKEYTPAQMLKWYSGLHTDSAEYKMWGNGIALPPALYVMQGMAEALDKEEDDAWLL